MADLIAAPTLTHIQRWKAQHLEAAADAWTARAQSWEHLYDAMLAGVSNPGGTPWHGAAAEAADQRVGADRRVVIGAADLLNDAAGIARAGAADIRAAKQVALDKVAAARGRGFAVEDDLSIVDTTTPVRALRAQREAEAVTHARGIWHSADILVATDQRVAYRIVEAAKGLRDLEFAPSGEQELPHSLLASYSEQMPPLPATPHLIYCYPSARPDFWWCEGYGIGTGPYGFDSPWDLSGVA